MLHDIITVKTRQVNNVYSLIGGWNKNITKIRSANE